MARPVVFTIVVAIVLTAAVARVPAQQAASTQTELLAEVRLLRQAIESLAGTNARVQIVFGRLQLQEQRTEAAARRLEVARQALAVFNLRANIFSDRLKDLEDQVTDTRLKPEILEQLRQEQASARRETDRLEKERAQLLQDEADAAGILNQEQGRWSDLNRQLDELERGLVKQ